MLKNWNNRSTHKTKDIQIEWNKGKEYNKQIQTKRKKINKSEETKRTKNLAASSKGTMQQKIAKF
jgi:hypothetical protein